MCSSAVPAASPAGGHHARAHCPVAKGQQERRQQQEAARQNFGGADRTLNYKGMVLAAVQELKEDRRGGASLPAIKKYCAAELGAKVPKLVTKAVRTLSEEGKLALGASAGRFKLVRPNFSFAKQAAARARREEEVRAYQRTTEEAVRRELAESAAAAQEARERHRCDKLHTEAARDRRRRAAAEAAEAAQQAMAQERQRSLSK